MTNIPDHVRLLGMIVNTVPFDYADNHVTASYDRYMEINDLLLLRQSIEQINNPRAPMPDDQMRVITDDIAFLDQVINTLQAKVNGDHN